MLRHRIWHRITPIAAGGIDGTLDADTLTKGFVVRIDTQYPDIDVVLDCGIDQDWPLLVSDNGSMVTRKAFMTAAPGLR